MTDETTKKWYESRTIAGAVAVIIGIVLRAIGLEVGSIETQMLVDLVSLILQVVGSSIVIHGRLTATKRIAP